MIDANGVQLYAEQAGQGDDVIFISGLADEGACWVDQVAGLERPLADHDVRQPRRRAVGDAAGRVPHHELRRGHRGADGRARHRARPRRRLVDGRRDRAGARTRPSGQGAQPRPQRHLLPRRPLLPRGHPQLAVGCGEVRQPARLPERRESLVLRAAHLQRGHHGGVADGRRGEPARPVGRRLLPLGRRADRARQLRPRRCDLRADARDRRRARPLPARALRPRAGRPHPGRDAAGDPASRAISRSRRGRRSTTRCSPSSGRRCRGGLRPG